MRPPVLVLPSDPKMLQEVVVKHIQSHPVHLIVHISSKTDRFPRVLMQILAKLPVQVVHRRQGIVLRPFRPRRYGPMHQTILTLKEGSGRMAVYGRAVFLLFVSPQGDIRTFGIEDDRNDLTEDGAETGCDGLRIRPVDAIKAGSAFFLEAGHLAFTAKSSIVDSVDELGLLSYEDVDIVQEVLRNTEAFEAVSGEVFVRRAGGCKAGGEGERLTGHAGDAGRDRGARCIDETADGANGGAGDE